MRWTERLIAYPRLVLLAALLLSVTGALAMVMLPKERTPRIKLPVIVVATPNPGSPPPVNESQIVRRIEENAGQLSGLKSHGSVVSEAVDGAAVVMFMFDNSVDVTDAKRDVESLVNSIKGEFPAEAQRDPGPQVNDIAFENYPVIQVFIAGGSEGRQRRKIAERLKSRLEKGVDGVAGIDIFGGLESEVQIDVHPHRMTLYGYTFDDIAGAIRRANFEAPSGRIEGGTGNDHRVRVRTKLENIEAIRQIPLGVRDGKPVILTDVATVNVADKARASMARYNSEDAVVLLVRSKTDIDVLNAATQVRDIVGQFVGNGENEGTHIGTVRSQAREIVYMLEQLGTSALYGTGLVIILLWIALGWRNALLIAISVPFALLTSAAMMWGVKTWLWPDLAINNMVLFAAIMVVGMVVDGCIIVGENIYRHRELGRSPVTAAQRGVHEVGPALVGAYMTTFMAFAAFFLVDGIMGEFLMVLPVVTLFSLIAAMLVDHFLLPVLSIYFMKSPAKQAANDGEYGGVLLAEDDDDAPATPEPTVEQLEVREAASSANSTRARRVYGRAIGYAMQHRILVLAMSALITATPFAAYYAGLIGVEFFPDSDYPVIEVYFELPLGSSMEKKTVVVAEQIEQAVNRAMLPDEWNKPDRNAPPVGPVTTIGEPGRLNTRVDTDMGSGPEFGMVYVELSMAEHRGRTSSEIRQAILKELPPMPGVIVRIKSPKEGPPAGAPIVLRVLGQRETDQTQLAVRAAEIERALREMPGTYDVTSDFRERPQLDATPDRVVAEFFDVNAAAIQSAVNYSLVGVKVGTVDFGSDEDMDLRLRSMDEFRDELRDLQNLPLRSPTGRIVSLDQVADVDVVRKANVIRHYDKKRVINIRAEVEPGVLIDDVKRALIRELRPELSTAEQAALTRDRDNKVIFSDQQIMLEFGGENEVRDEAIADLSIALVVAVLGMFVVLVVKFNSFSQALIVLFSVPLSLIGVALGLGLCGFSFSVSALIGVVALAGVVVNDAIVLVEFINQLRAGGVPMDKAVVYAGQLRLRPIILTTVTTVGGMLPLAVNIAGGGEFWQPLAIAMICGLSFATILQLFVVPLAVYTFTPRARAKDASADATTAIPSSPAVA